MGGGCCGDQIKRNHPQRGGDAAANPHLSALPNNNIIILFQRRDPSEAFPCYFGAGVSAAGSHFPLASANNSPPPATEEGSGGGGSGAQRPSKEPSPYRRRDPFPPPFFAGDLTCRNPIAEPDRPHPPENRCFSPRTTADLPGEQMTIFYDGMINVYDDVSADQARAIMDLAASPACFDDPTDPLPPARRPVFRLPPGPAPPFARAFRIRATGETSLSSPLSSVKQSRQILIGRLPVVQAGCPTVWRAGWRAGGCRGKQSLVRERSTLPEVSTSRKASLQRYLEKRKDRFKGKKILGGSTSSDMEMMYISQKLRCLNHSELPNLNEASFPSLSQPPQSPARCSSGENQSGDKYFIDLNDDISYGSVARQRTVKNPDHYSLRDHNRQVNTNTNSCGTCYKSSGGCGYLRVTKALLSRDAWETSIECDDRCSISPSLTRYISPSVSQGIKLLWLRARARSERGDYCYQ
ncbi:hypothetical protein C4D60_Mb08t27100 [Musa balbisiana]|uniref:Protein TIFY n=1 Tax=Musa balbisiana TaxID=52838 RepID=A0A4S8K6V4_MUSBA|nr:hypothetical protein C4D60_Mb08t27100 [Musa balbisiana]